MLIKDYYKPDEARGYQYVMKEFLLAKYEKNKALIAIEKKDERTEYFGVNDQIVLQKSIDHYSKKAEVKRVFWFYTKELIAAA